MRIMIHKRRKKRKQKKKSITYLIDDGTVERKYSLLSALISEFQAAIFLDFSLCVSSHSPMHCIRGGEKICSNEENYVRHLP